MLKSDSTNYLYTYLIELFCTYIGTQKTWLAPSVCPISDQNLTLLTSNLQGHLAEG